MDVVKNIYRYEVTSKQGSMQKMYQDKRIAIEICQNSTFIELHPTDKDIWALNSMRQLSVCRDFKSKLSKNDQIQFEHINEMCHVMKAAIGNKH